MRIEDEIRELLARPADQQVAAAFALLEALPGDPGEPWNSRFGPGSRFDAWNETSVARAARAALAAELRPWLDARPGWTAIEVGGGDGRLWRELLRPDDRGTLVVVDRLPEAVERVAAAVPAGVRVEGRVGPVEEVALPAADAVVCALTLHHVAGADAADRARHGLSGPGKREVLEAFGRSLAGRGGAGWLLEADIDCEIDLPTGDPALADHLFDSYVRRCARSICDDLERPGVDPDLARRWRDLVHHWFLGQVRQARVPLADRDVYELTVDRWLALLTRSGLRVEAHRFTDDLPLFHLYRFRPGL